MLSIFAVFSVNVYALPGSGTEADPWLIQSLVDFNDFAADANYWDDYTRLETDVNLSGVYTTAVIAPDTDNLTEGYQGTPFGGTFDGNDHTIINLTIDTNNANNNYLGLFGSTDTNSIIKNLNIEDCNVTGGDSYNIGSLVGRNFGSVSDCYATGGVTCGGGFDSEDLGGLVGDNVGSINKCYATVSVIGTGSANLGGLAGKNDQGDISNCYATGSVTGALDVGGLVGENEGSGTISNCYSTGSVTGVSIAGGLVGHNSSGDIVDSFWDTETSGMTTSNGGTGKTTVEMQMESTFTDAGWDFVEIWNIGKNQTYPYLRVYPAGDLNHDHRVDMLDFAIFADHWLAGME
jgi:hypothetical protein